MDLELATTDDIVEELKRRDARFVLVVVESTNRMSPSKTCIAGQGKDPDDIVRLCGVGAEAFAELHGED